MTIKTLGIDHIHFNVLNLKRFREIMKQLFGPDITPIGYLKPHGMYNSCVSFADATAQTFLDVFQAASESSYVAEHIRQRGQGVSYVSFKVEGIEAAAAHAAKCGLTETSRIGYRGMKQVQFDTYDELGFQLEFVEYEPTFGEDLAKVKERLRAGETVDGLSYVEL